MGAPGCVRVRRRGSWGQKTRTGSVGQQEEEVRLQLLIGDWLLAESKLPVHLLQVLVNQ